MTAPLNIKLRADYVADEWQGFQPVATDVRTFRVNNQAKVSESAMRRFWNLVWN